MARRGGAAGGRWHQGQPREEEEGRKGEGEVGAAATGGRRWEKWGLGFGRGRRPPFFPTKASPHGPSHNGLEAQGPNALDKNLNLIIIPSLNFVAIEFE